MTKSTIVAIMTEMLQEIFNFIPVRRCYINVYMLLYILSMINIYFYSLK